MRAFVTTIALAVVASVGAQAETSSIRSGDHASFTRLVFTIPSGADWALGRSEAGYELRVDGVSDFDPSGVFDRISRERIAALATDERLGIEIACECHADAFLWRADRLVVDIVDGNPPEDSTFEDPLDGPDPGPIAREAQWRPRSQTSILPIVGSRDMPPGATLEPSLIDGSAGQMATTTQQMLADTPTWERIAAAEASLLSSLSSAIDEGFVALAPGEFPASLDGADTSGLAIDALMPSAVSPGLSARTALQGDAGAAITPSETVCPPDPHFQVADWSDQDESFVSQLAGLRAGSELDGRLDPDDLLALARFYVSFGLQTEAMAVLSVSGNSDGRHEAVMAIAAYLDGAEAQRGLVMQARHCGGAPSFWAVASRGSLEGISANVRRDVLETFMSLPDALIGLTGTDLAMAFAEAGLPNEADAILSRTRMSGFATQESGSRVQATLESMTNSPEAARDTLAESIDGNDIEAARNALELMQISLQGDQPLSEDEFAVIEILVHEQTGTEIGNELARAQIRSTIYAADFSAASRLIESYSGMIQNLGPNAVRDLNEEFAMAMAQRGPDSRFLALAFNDDAISFRQDTRREMADRLIQLGFEDRALTVRSGGWSAPSSDGSDTPTESRSDLETSTVVQPDNELAGLAEEVRSAPATLADRRDLLLEVQDARSRIDALLLNSPSPISTQ